MRLARLLTLVVALGAIGAAHAHSPVTAIGRAVTGLQSVPVTYDPEAALGPREADGLLLRVRDTPVRVAVMPAFALEEIAGGADAIAAEIAREARLDGSVVVVAGTELGAWSDRVAEDELVAIVARARASSPGTELAVAVDNLVAEVVAVTPPADEGLPWVWIAVAGTAVLGIATALWVRRAERAPTSS